MFGEILKRVREAVGVAERKPAAIPDGLRVYAIGDIHGRDDLLGNMLRRIDADAHAYPPARNVLVFLGDYVDRGLQSKQVLDRLTAHPLSGFETVYLKGNHEAAMLEFLRDANFGRTWKYYGGLETLHSYGITELTLSDNPDDFEQAQQHLQRVLPPAHRHFLETLQPSIEIGDYFFVHAGVAPGISLSRQVEDDLLWIRDKFLQSDTWFGKMIVHGHTPKERPVFRHNRIGIDTGAYMTNVLTCLVLQGTEARIIQTADVMVPDFAGNAAG
ncbi:metallophosphoesterase family protein [Parvibaculum sp.]|uniref:metallophosphoesterase family protein n=1 Tax=Parvibaculum sp. TaxID=2024848 RepID=UPI00320DCAE0